jgi:aquaglyceroporin related protein
MSPRQALLAKPDDSNFLSLSIGWGVGLLLGVLVSGDISGAHLNPAMTLVMATLRGFPWSQVPGYILSQLFGAVIGGVISQSNYYELVNQVEGGAGLRTLGNANSTALIFITGPADWMSYTGEAEHKFVGLIQCRGIL